MTYRTSVAVFAALVAIAGTALAQPPSAAPTPSPEKQKMIQLGIEQKTAAGLYKYLKQKANGGQPLTLENGARLDRRLDARGEPVRLGSRPDVA